MAANADGFREEPKTITGRDRMEALLMATSNRSWIDESPDLEPDVRDLLERNAALLTRLAS